MFIYYKNHIVICEGTRVVFNDLSELHLPSKKLSLSVIEQEVSEARKESCSETRTRTKKIEVKFYEKS